MFKNKKSKEILKVKHNTRTYIDQTTKCNLIKTVIDDHLTIYQAALLFKLKYSTAKHILRNFNQEARETFQRQRRKRTNLISKYSTIIINQCSGDIKLQINEQIFEVLPDLASIIEKCRKEILQYQSLLLYKSFQTSQIESSDESFQINLNSQLKSLMSDGEKIRFLTALLKKQHSTMSKYE